MLESEPVS